MSRATAALAAVLALAALPAAAHARPLVHDGDFRLELRSSFKSSLVLAFPPDDPILYPDRPAGAGLFRLRFELKADLGTHLTAVVAYEQRARASSPGAIGSGVFPSDAPVPFRLWPLDEPIVDAAPGYLHEHELDRAFVAMHFDFLELTVGRQAIGLGRGVLFSAVDVFAPFGPTEIDREWRRGVDAVHAEVRVPGVTGVSADVYAAFGGASTAGLANWALLGRVRAVVGDVDGAVIFGKRGDDNLAGATMSATLGDFEVHGEGALYRTNGAGIDGGFFGTRNVVAKAVLGGSYQIDVGTGLRVVAEYHYSGFGADDIAARPGILLDPAFQARLATGDSQILGRHVLAVALSYDLADDLAASLTYLQSPVDGSGLVAPTLTWSQSDDVTLLASALVPWGSGPRGGLPTSEWGAFPVTLFVQARFYD